MTDVFTKVKRSKVMAAIRSGGNKDTELRLRAIFRKYGIVGWRRNQAALGKPDFIFRRARVAVFVDGCFWHGCPKHGRKPRSNQSYWRAKLERNKVRDAEVNRMLRKLGWSVLRVWEHDLASPERIIRRISRAVLRGLQFRS